MPYCEKCGNQIDESASFCSACGTKRNVGETQAPQQNYANNTYQYQQPIVNNENTIIETLRSKVRTEAIVWIVVASIQVLLFLVYLISEDIVSAIIILGVSIVNFLTCKKDFDFEKKIVTEPVGIVDKYKPIGGYIFALIYNLIFGGVIGVVGSIFCFVTRSYVIQNEQQFVELENNYKTQHTINN